LELSSSESKSPHCIHCGYDRRGLAESQPCPECGHIDHFAPHQFECVKIANKPLKLFWRLITFRPPPAGWWEVFDQPHLHPFTTLRTALLIFVAALLTATFMAGGNLVRNDLLIHRTAKAWLYRNNDPKRQKVQDYGSGSETVSIFDRAPRGTYVKFPLHPIPGLTSQVDWQEKLILRSIKPLEYILYPAAMIIFIACAWLIYRQAWLGAILWTHPDLAAADRAAAHRAAAPLSLIFLALPIAMFITLAVLFAFQTLISFPAWVFNVVAAVMLIYPPLLFRVAIRADVSRRIFPNRALAALFLAAAALINSLILGLCIGSVSLILRFANST